VKIKLHADVSVDISFDVVSENPIVPVAVEAPRVENYERPYEKRERKPRRE
jgi:large subunit ribosomal protein L9